MAETGFTLEYGQEEPHLPPGVAGPVVARSGESFSARQVE